MKSIKKIILFLLTITISISSSTKLKAEETYEERLLRHIKDRKNKKLNPKFKQLKQREEFEKDAREKLDELQKNIDALIKSDEENDEENTEKIEKLIERKQRYEDILAGDMGDVILSTLAGSYLKHTQVDYVGNNWKEGTKKGMTILGVGSATKALGKNFESYSSQGFGWLFKSLEEKFLKTWNFVFHHNKMPFTEPEITSWKNLISSELAEMDKIIRNADKSSARSLEEKLRELSVDIETEVPKEIMNLWLDLTEDLAITLEDLALEIESRSAYYGKKNDGFGIINCADRLKNKLLKIRKWILSVQSAKDFASLREIKTVLPSMKKSVDNYFLSLKNQIKPTKSKADKSSSPYSSYSGRSTWNNDSKF